MKHCADCGGEIGKDNGPADGWQLEDGRTVCQRCYIKDLRRQGPRAMLRAMERLEHHNQNLDADLERMNYEEMRLLSWLPVVALVVVIVVVIVLAVRLWTLS